MVKMFFIAVVVLLGSIYAAAAQFNGCLPGICPGSFGRGLNGGGTTAVITPCTSTGVLDLGNVCNDIYFIGALK